MDFIKCETKENDKRNKKETNQLKKLSFEKYAISVCLFFYLVLFYLKFVFFKSLFCLYSCCTSFYGNCESLW